MKLTKRQAVILYHTWTCGGMSGMVSLALDVDVPWLDCDGKPEHIAHDRQDEMNAVALLREMAEAIENNNV